jgi:hypothetical protein
MVDPLEVTNADLWLDGGIYSEGLSEWSAFKLVKLHKLGARYALLAHSQRVGRAGCLEDLGALVR